MCEKPFSYERDLADLVHDMRAPITAIRAFAGAMLEGTVRGEEHPKYLHLIQDEADRLNRMISDLLSAERLSSKTLRLQSSVFNLTELMRLTLLSIAEQIEAKGIDVETECEELFVEGDKGLLSEVLYNLLENACKYTPKGGKIYLYAQRNSGMARITVKNTGVTFGREDAHLVFDRCFRGNTEEKGTGLGLYNVKGILALHGSVPVAEADGECTSFSFELREIPK